MKNYLNLRHYLLSVLVLLGTVNCWAQSQLSVANFRLLENDLTAQRQGSSKNDLNGRKAALIKISTLETGFSFDGGSLGVVDVVSKPGEVWLYVPHHAQRLTISHKQLGVLRNYTYPIPIEGGRTYEMLLDVGIGRYVTITTNPAGASITVDGQQKGLSPVYNCYLTYGQHTIQARNGIMEGEEKLTISQNDRKEARIVTVEMAEGAVDEVGVIKPANINSMEKMTQKSYYIKGLRTIRLNMNMEYPTPAPSLERFASLILFGDTVNTSLQKAADAFVSSLGEAKKTTENRITHWYTISMTPTDYKHGYYYCYFLKSEFKNGDNNQGRQCLIIYDATTDRVLSVSDVFNPATVQYINSKVGNTFKHMYLENGSVVVKYQQDNDFQSLFFFLDDKTKIQPYFMALTGKDQEQKNRDLESNIDTSEEFSDGRYRYKILSDEEVEIILYVGSKTQDSIDIPSSVTSKGKVYTVTSIGSSSMRGLDATAIVIPATIKSIGEMAFLECKKLKTLSVDADNPNYCAVDNVLMTKDKKKIILYPSCKTGSDYTIPATIDAIERYAFGNCKLRSVTIPAATVAIPSTAFSGCLHLSTINVSDNNANYSSQDNVLMSKDGKTLLRYPAGKQDNAYTVPLSVEQIEREAFSECNLASLYIKNENIKIADYAFRDCRNLSTVQIPSKIAPELDRTVFADCDRLETITLDGDGRSISAESYKEGGRDKVYDTVEQMPSFPGGTEALFSWINNNLKYPAEAEENGVQGRVVCAFVVERDGSIRNIQVVKSIYPSLDAEAIRLLNKMPRWSPGKQSGIPVRTKFTLPFTFKLQ